MTKTANPDWKKLNPPADVAAILTAAPKVYTPRSLDDMLAMACNGPDQDHFEVAYDVPGQGRVVEANVARVRNGLSVNYPEPYMRRRDPDSMLIADELPTDKPRFRDKMNGEFEPLREETFAWLKTQELAVFGFRAGPDGLGVLGLAIAPANAGFFAYGLALLQEYIPLDELSADFVPRLVIYVAPPFRHTHFEGRQMVVHRRTEALHEAFAYNLYPGPSAKKGVYSSLIHFSEQAGWIVAHCATVQAVTPYDNIITIMHEGASGSGKSELLEMAHREPDGRLLLGRNVLNGEERFLQVPRMCELHPVNDDMALCHPSLQKNDGRLRLVDAENAWFVRVNHIQRYATDPHFEALTAQPPRPLLFLNIDAVPRGRALIWEHIEDEPGKPCPNPRVVLPREVIPNITNRAVAVDIRSFGIRTPACTRDKPSYGIIGVFHLLPPALAWLWRLVAPRGHANPSIIATKGMSSEGVGSYWPFATGRKVDQANLLLEQIIEANRTRYVLCPNQHIGAWNTGFMPEWIMREYLARRGLAKFRSSQIQPSRCSLLGYALNHLTVEGTPLSRWFLQVDTQPEVGPEAYDKGAAELTEFFHRCLRKFLDPDLHPVGRQIIECCLDGGAVTDYEGLVKELEE